MYVSITYMDDINMNEYRNNLIVPILFGDQNVVLGQIFLIVKAYMLPKHEDTKKKNLPYIVYFLLLSNGLSS